MAKHWMAEAFAKNKGGLHRATNTPEGKTIPQSKVYRAARSKDEHTRQMAQAALNANPRRYGQ